MAIFQIGDIPTGALYGSTISHASVASDGAGASLGGAGAVGKFRAPQACKIVSVFWEAEGADSAASNTASYRRLTLIDGGADASGTAVIASLNLTASLASDTQRSFSLATNATAPAPLLDAGDCVYASHATIGGDHSNGTVLVAGSFRFYYMPTNV